VSRIESEAMTVLLQRRQALRKARAVPQELAGGAGLAADVAPPDPPSEVERLELAEIDAALGRIAAGRYGSCFSCGGPLGLQRIRAFPETRYCLGCSGQPANED
jgi:hypothetical protein